MLYSQTGRFVQDEAQITIYLLRVALGRERKRCSRWATCCVWSDYHCTGHIFFCFSSGSREAAYLYAVWSSGLTYAIAQACSQGAISSCGCDPTKRGGKELVRSLHHRSRAHNAATAIAAGGGGNPQPSTGWKWGGCSADVRAGASLAKRFADSRETEGDGRSLMNLHNNKAGRKVSKEASHSVHSCYVN